MHIDPWFYDGKPCIVSIGLEPHSGSTRANIFGSMHMFACTYYVLGKSCLTNQPDRTITVPGILVSLTPQKARQTIDHQRHAERQDLKEQKHYT
jgi:hypothetical protein